jgi:hypothetical protein
MFRKKRLEKWIDEAEYFLIDKNCKMVYEAIKLEKRRHRKKAWKSYIS